MYQWFKSQTFKYTRTTPTFFKLKLITSQSVHQPHILGFIRHDPTFSRLPNRVSRQAPWRSTRGRRQASRDPGPPWISLSVESHASRRRPPTPTSHHINSYYVAPLSSRWSRCVRVTGHFYINTAPSPGIEIVWDADFRRKRVVSFVCWVTKVEELRGGARLRVLWEFDCLFRYLNCAVYMCVVS